MLGRKRERRHIVRVTPGKTDEPEKMNLKFKKSKFVADESENNS